MENNDIYSEITENDFADEKSVNIFRYRYLFWKSGDWKYLLKMVCDGYSEIVGKANRLYSSLKERIAGTTDKRLAVYGYGFAGRRLGRKLSSDKLWESPLYIDKNADSFEHDKDVSILNLKKAEDFARDILILIPNGIYAAEMERQAIKWGGEFLKIPDYFADYDLIDEKNNLWELFKEKKSRFFVYGQDWRSFLFRYMLQCAGRPADFTMAEEIEVSDNFDFMKYGNYYAFVFGKGRADYLLSRGVEKKRIIPLVNLDEVQYFDEEVVPKHKDFDKETFIDGGVLNLMSSGGFLHWCSFEYDKIWAFECDNRCAEKCKKLIEKEETGYEKTVLIRKGIWSSNTVLSIFESDTEGGTSLKKEEGDLSGDKKIEVTTIDDAANGEKVTFIKMDIEGSELEALKGARNTILNYHPILAISIYHKPEDIVEIPTYIKNEFPWYRLYLRNYHMDYTEGVLYAV